MTTLTDIQLDVLSKAAAREDGAATPPAQLSKAAATKLASRLVALKLARVPLAKPDMPVWRKDSNGRPTSLVITRAGRKAVEGCAPVQSLDHETPSGTGASPNAHDPRSDKRSSEQSTCDKTGPSIVSSQGPTIAVPRAATKQALVLGLLQKPEGATLQTLVAATGWLPHTVRAALTVLRRRGFAIERQVGQGGSPSTYRLAAHVPVAA